MTKANGKGTKATYPRWERLPLGRLAPNDSNPRSVTDEALGRLTRSLAEFGNISPVTFNARTKRLVGGHQRLKCLLAMGHKETDVWVVDLPPKKEKLANLALNNSAGEWDEAQLAEILRGLGLQSPDIDLAGFRPELLERLLAEIKAPDEFKPVDENTPVDHQCPKCGFTWSGGGNGS